MSDSARALGGLGLTSQSSKAGFDDLRSRIFARYVMFDAFVSLRFALAAARMGISTILIRRAGNDAPGMPFW